MREKSPEPKNGAGCVGIRCLRRRWDVDVVFLLRATEDAQRFVGIFAEAMDGIMPEPAVAYTIDEVPRPPLNHRWPSERHEWRSAVRRSTAKTHGRMTHGRDFPP